MEEEKIFYFHRDKKNKYWLFRIFGAGISCKHTSRWKLSFSERNGYKKYLKIGNYIFSYLPKF